jgi:prefoldin subunit 5
MAVVRKSVTEVNSEISKLGNRIEALNAGINRLNGDRDFIQQKRVLEEMKTEYEKRLNYLKDAINGVQISIQE